MTDAHPEQPVLASARLRLRPFVPGDAPGLARLCADRAVAETTLRIPHPYTLDHAEAFLASLPEAWAAGQEAVFAQTLRDGGDLVGAIGLKLEPEHLRAELGYWVGVPYWGRGYATEAVRAVAGWAFLDLGLGRLYAHVMGGNAASERVLLKAGFSREGLLRRHVRRWGRTVDCPLFGLLKDEFGRAAPHPTSEQREEASPAARLQNPKLDYDD